MRVILIANPRSGSGKGLTRATEFATELRTAGLSVNVLETGPNSSHLLNAGVLKKADALAVLGGDGTLNTALDLARVNRVPIYHVPAGNENLFAREFGMTGAPSDLAEAVRAQRVLMADVGVANGRLFALMVSVGLDASVVHRVAQTRTTAVGHRAYVLPGLREIKSPCLPRLRIEVDGSTLVEDQRGIVVIANSRHYGVDLDPARHAEIDDGQLDIVFLPARTRVGVLGWAVDLRLGWHLKRKRLVYAKGTQIRVESLEDNKQAPVQLDGEAPGITPSGTTNEPSSQTPLSVGIEPATLPVLLPANAAGRIQPTPEAEPEVCAH
ncbi:MAG: diacylglycerol kinase family protein [Planctomycetota bacterium]